MILLLLFPLLLFFFFLLFFVFLSLSLTPQTHNKTTNNNLFSSYSWNLLKYFYFTCVFLMVTKDTKLVIPNFTTTTPQLNINIIIIIIFPLQSLFLHPTSSSHLISSCSSMINNNPHTSYPQYHPSSPASFPSFTAGTHHVTRP